MHVLSDPITLSPVGKVLLVEGDQSIRDGVQMLLEGDGLEVAAADNGRAAVAWAEQERPALVVLDLDLPVIDGVAVGSVLRARFGALLPIVIFSADTRAYAKTRHLGPCGLVRKPFVGDVLVAAVRRGLKGSGFINPKNALPSHRTPERRQAGDDIPALDGDLGLLAAELRGHIDAGVLDGFGAVRLFAGPFADASLAGQTLLADLDHLASLARHTGEAPTPDRWELLADELYLLLLTLGRRPDGGTDGQHDGVPLAS